MGKNNSRFFIHGIAAAMALTMVYVIIVTAAQGFSHALATFSQLWYLMVPLIAGFGVQAGLFSYVHSLKSVSSKTVAASGGVSTVSMVACCAHHVTDVLPLLGLTALSLFLTQYQTFFIALGIFSNVIGITFMLGIIQDKRLYAKKSVFGSVMRYDMQKIRNTLIAVSMPVLAVIFMLAR